MTGDLLIPTAYYPPVSYFAFLLKSKNTLIEQMESFPKQTFRNRCEIMTDAGKANLVVPVTRPQGNHTLTKNIEIANREPWQRNHWKTLQTGYRSSPFFNFYTDILEQHFSSSEVNLLTNNTKILKTFLSLIGIELSFDLTKDYKKKPEGMIDLRAEFSPKRSQYIFEFPLYPQVFSHKFGFMPDLSILDLLFNVGPEARSYLESIVIKEVGLASS